MLVESIAITAIFAILIFINLRARKRNFAIATAPLMFVPFSNILAKLLAETFGSKIITNNIQAGIVIFGLAIGVALIGVASQLLKVKRSKIMYISICGAFSTVLTIIILFNSYIKL